MGRFLLKLGALALVLALVTAGVYAFVYRYDENGYFGQNEKFDGNNPTGKMVRFRNAPCENIIIGDSRIYELRENSMARLEELTGKKWFNMGVCGASQPDMNKQFWYCDSLTELKTVIMTVSFVRMQINDHTDHVSTVLTQLENPLRYIYSIDTLKSGWTMLLRERAEKKKEAAGGSADGTAEKKESTPPEPSEKAVRKIAELCSYRDGYVVNTRVLDELREIAATCEKKGIEFIVVALPYRSDSRDYVINKLGLREKIESYKQEIASFATLYDMEFDSEFCSAEYYSDNMHLNPAGRIRFVEAIAKGDDAVLKIRRG